MVTINLFIDENDKDVFKPCYDKQLELHKFDEDHNINSYDIIMPYANIKYYDWFKHIIAKNNNIENRTKFIIFFTKLLDSMITYLTIDKNSYFYTKKNSEITEDDLKDGEKEIQKITDNCIKDIEAVADAKEKEIMEI